MSTDSLLDLQTTTGTIDRGMDTKNAQKALAKQRRLKEYAAAEENSQEPVRQETNDSGGSLLDDMSDFLPATAGLPTVTKTVPMPPLSAVTASLDVTPVADNVITIVDDKIPIELEYNPAGAQGAGLSLSFKAASVQKEDTGISILLRAEFTLKLPTMQNITLRMHRESFLVWYVGGTHRIGTFINIPFIILPNNGKTGSSESRSDAE